MADDHHSNTSFWSGFFIGGLIGAVIIFFLGTKEGKQAQKILKKKSEDVIDDVQDRLDNLEEKGKELVQQGEAFRNSIVKKIEERKEKLGENVTDHLDKTLSNIEHIQKQGLSTTANLRKRIFRNIPKRTS